MEKILVVFLLLLFCFPAFAKPKTFGNVTVDEVVSIYDADTFKVNIKGWPDIVGHRISIRLNVKRKSNKLDKPKR